MLALSLYGSDFGRPKIVEVNPASMEQAEDWVADSKANPVFDRVSWWILVRVVNGCRIRLREWRRDVPEE